MLVQECLAGGCRHRGCRSQQQRSLPLLLGLVLLLTHFHRGKLTSLPVLPAVAAAPHPERSVRVVKAVLVPGSAGGRAPRALPGGSCRAGVPPGPRRPPPRFQPLFSALPYCTFPCLSVPKLPDP